jgi:hypothetical protein
MNPIALLAVLSGLAALILLARRRRGPAHGEPGEDIGESPETAWSLPRLRRGGGEIPDRPHPMSGATCPSVVVCLSPNIGPRQTNGRRSRTRRRVIRVLDEHDLNPIPKGGWETNVAVAFDDVFVTGNWFAAYSSDHGAAWSAVSPQDMQKGIAGGFCCDQRILFIPQIYRFVWVLLSADAGGENGIK